LALYFLSHADIVRFYDDDDADDDDEIYLERDRLKVIRYMLSPWQAAGKNAETYAYTYTNT